MEIVKIENLRILCEINSSRFLLILYVCNSITFEFGNFSAIKNLKKVIKMEIQSIWNCQNGSFIHSQFTKVTENMKFSPQKMYKSKSVFRIMKKVFWQFWRTISPNLKVLSLKFGQNENFYNLMSIGCVEKKLT